MAKKKEVSSGKSSSETSDTNTAPKRKGSRKKEVKEGKDSKDASKDGAKEKIDMSMSLENKAFLSVKSLSKRFRKKLVLKDVDFEVEEKDIFGVVGMSGSGKSTLFHLMAGVFKQTSGDVLIRRDVLFDKDAPQQPDYVSVYRNLTRARKKIGFASQTPSFYEHLTVEENMKLYGSMHGICGKRLQENMKRLLRMVGLEDEKETVSAQLSGGMQRRLDIALALLHEPKILFLDEPTSDLDPVMRIQIWALIKEINQQGTTILIASHILEEIEQLCTKIAILHGKRIVGYGSLEELKGLFARYQEVRIRLESGNYDNLMRKLRRESLVIDKMFEKEGVLVVYTRREGKNLSSILKLIEQIDERILSLDISEAHLTEIFEMLAKKEEELQI
ncbi:TPA: ABC transporter ATP-binding protein [Candidatus Woesearchaeota archaeon]|nr:ABC transporter ATP-binding protein [Candidatus Woesearchaeota archaeon]